MKLKRFLALILAFLLTAANPAVFSYSADLPANLPANVRVGIRALRNAPSVPIGNQEIVIGYETNQSFTQSAALVSASGAFSAVPADMYYVRTDYRYSDYASALQSADNYTASGYKACVALLDDFVFAVYFGGYQSESEAESVKNNLSGGYVLNPEAYRTAITDGANPVIVFDNPEKNGQLKSDVLQAGGTQHRIQAGGTWYRGGIEISRAGGGITAINVLSMEEYLYSVVPSEMPASWHTEAHKAQAVASRSYAYANLSTHAESNYNFCDGEHCQAYKGIDQETEQTTKAVLETAGLTAYYQNKPINAVYHASSGGATADSEAVWNEAIPYLRGVPDSYDKTGPEWRHSVKLSEITALLNSNGYNIGQAVSVTIAAVSVYGHVDKLTVTGTDGTVTLEKEEVRTFFSGSADGTLESRLFGIGEQFLPNIPQTTVKPTAAAPAGTVPADTAPSASAKVFVLGNNTTGEYTLSSMYIYLRNGLPPVNYRNTASAVNASAVFVIGQTGGDVSGVNGNTSNTNGGAAGTGGNASSTNGASPSAGQTTGNPAPDLAQISNSATTAQTNAGVTSSTDPIIFTGRGYGHGAGMSQHGANGMAEAGFTFREILSHYYTGIEIK